MKSTRRVTTVAALLLVALPCVSAEPPRHYFTGRVCRGSTTSFQPGDVPCEHPLRGVAVTLKNSDTSFEGGVGLTVFLQRQRAAKKKVTVY